MEEKKPVERQSDNSRGFCCTVKQRFLFKVSTTWYFWFYIIIIIIFLSLFTLPISFQHVQYQLRRPLTATPIPDFTFSLVPGWWWWYWCARENVLLVVMMVLVRERNCALGLRRFTFYFPGRPAPHITLSHVHTRARGRASPQFPDEETAWGVAYVLWTLSTVLFILKQVQNGGFWARSSGIFPRLLRQIQNYSAKSLKRWRSCFPRKKMGF